MGSRKQSYIDRLQRLNRGSCPVHGLWMSQVDVWYEEIGGQHDGAHYTIVACPRRDCDIRAKAFSIDGPWELLPEWVHLLKETE